MRSFTEDHGKFQILRNLVTSSSRVDLDAGREVVDSSRFAFDFGIASRILYGRSSIPLFRSEGTPPRIERPCRVSVLPRSMRAQMYRTHFALKRFLCFRISSNTFSKRKCLYFGGRNVKRVSRSSFNFFYVPLVKKKKKKGEREKSEKALSTSSRVSHSKNFEATRKCSAETPSFASFGGKRESRNTRGTKYSTNIRVNGAF